jgi:hypothetical protein
MVTFLRRKYQVIKSGKVERSVPVTSEIPGLNHCWTRASCNKTRAVASIDAGGRQMDPQASLKNMIFFHADFGLKIPKSGVLCLMTKILATALKTLAEKACGLQH